MHNLSVHIVAPIRKFQTAVSAVVPFSIAELLIALAVIWVVVMIYRWKWKELLTGSITIALTVYALFCFLWGTYYYGEVPTEAKSVSKEQLGIVTLYFAQMANENYCEEPDRAEVLDKSPELYDNHGIAAKGIVCSKIMSLLDFTGFFCPFTGEANVNLDSPAHDLPATVAHELAHLQGTAREQEANFLAVKSSLEYGDRSYVYSAALLAYTHLGNSLHDTDYQTWYAISQTLSDDVKEDLSETREYWDRYNTSIKTASNKVYESFLYSYGQELGLKSYGACVDLLVEYYYEDALAATRETTLAD